MQQQNWWEPQNMQGRLSSSPSLLLLSLKSRRSTLES